jgi:mono/diheme cytochrome c family protein
MRRVFPIIILVLSIAGLTGGCKYDDGRAGEYHYRTDMHTQPSYKPQEDPLPPADGAVPVAGYQRQIPDSTTANNLPNPVSWTPRDAERGKALYTIHCSPCHAVGGKGDGLVAPVFQTPPDITTGKYIAVTDGYLYWVIRNGVGIMPAYYEHLKSHERWLIVNHIRSLQAE